MYIYIGIDKNARALIYIIDLYGQILYEKGAYRRIFEFKKYQVNLLTCLWNIART